jgi:hypothetical protein
MRSFLAALLVLAACSSDDTDAEPGRGVLATVSYAGAVEGSLILAAFTSFPPAGGPVGLAQMAAPTFPAELSLADLAPGEYHVLALLDAEPASPTQPGPEDLTAWTMVTVTDGAATEIAMTLTDAP